MQGKEPAARTALQQDSRGVTPRRKTGRTEQQPAGKAAEIRIHAAFFSEATEVHTHDV